MNILYLSCHEILEYDEIKLFTEMGHKVVSYGAYSNPHNPAILRPKIPGMFFDDELYSMVLQSGKDFVHQKLLEWADVVIVMHKQEWIAGMSRAKRIIWRSIGQNTEGQEVKLKFIKSKFPQLQIIRYSPYERRILNYAGEDTIIRFYKDPDEYKEWVGSIPEVMSVAQSLPHPGRERELNWKAFKIVTQNLPIKLFGPGNEQAGSIWGGRLDYQALKRALRHHRAYFYTGTMPAPYTLGFIEALMTGIPVVAIGNKLGYDDFYRQDTYEVADLLDNRVNGFASDDTKELHNLLKELIANENLAREMGMKGRELAIELFGKATIRKQWEEIL